MTSDNDDSILIGKREAARRLGISVTEIDECRRRGDIGAKRYGSKVLFDVDELRRFASALPSDEPRT